MRSTARKGRRYRGGARAAAGWTPRNRHKKSPEAATNDLPGNGQTIMDRISDSCSTSNVIPQPTGQAGLAIPDRHRQHLHAAWLTNDSPQAVDCTPESAAGRLCPIPHRDRDPEAPPVARKAVWVRQGQCIHLGEDHRQIVPALPSRLHRAGDDARHG